MEPLSWFGGAGAIVEWPFMIAAGLFIIAIAAALASYFANIGAAIVGADGAKVATARLTSSATSLSKWPGLAIVAIILLYAVMSMFYSAQERGIAGNVILQFMPVWLAMIVVFATSITFRKKLGLYGKLFQSPVGMIGFALVIFWVFTALFGALDLITTHDSLSQIARLKNKVPGTPLPSPEEGQFPWYLLGGDNLGRDVFSRMVAGSSTVIVIAPLATFFGYIVGITLGLPAGYYSGAAITRGSVAFYVIASVAALAAAAAFIVSGAIVGVVVAAIMAALVTLLLYSNLDTILSFLANLILAFPVILLFYLLVTPEIVSTGIPNYMAAVFFIFPIIFIAVLLNSRYKVLPHIRTPLLTIVLIIAFWVYFSAISDVTRNQKTAVDFFPNWLDLFNVDDGILVVFIAVVFVNSPTIFRIMRGLTMDVKNRDYVAAAQTRGETPWYIMLWEILPNVRGPLIVDFCLRIGYATILLGTLGFFGLGLEPESPDWGSTINTGRKLILAYIHPLIPPAMALLSLVLGLNLLADGLREQSLKD